jgi:hypothetical protein
VMQSSVKQTATNVLEHFRLNIILDPNSSVLLYHPQRLAVRRYAQG